MPSPDWVRVPRISSEAAVDLVLKRFPPLAESAAEAHQLRLAQPFSAFELLAVRISKRRSDPDFLRTACDFINELAESDDPTLQDALSVSLLEGIASDERMAELIRTLLRPAAAEILQRIETEHFGRRSLK